jgi:hypothetical protein
LQIVPSGCETKINSLESEQRLKHIDELFCMNVDWN